jgi:predicted transcriptional regulator
MERSKPSYTSTAPPPPGPAIRGVILTLIQEELKSRKLFDELRWLSYHNWFYKTDLLDLIMRSIGLDPRLSIQRSLCHTLLDQHSQRVVENAAELLNEANRVYDALWKHTRQLGYMNDGSKSKIPNSKPADTESAFEI